jgi:hypothetical protein
VPATKKSVFDLSAGPAHIVLYQKNIEAVCSNEAEVVIRFARLSYMNSVIISA